MVAVSLSLLAFAAGLYLLVKIKREFLGGLFEGLAWFLIVFSLVSVGYSSYQALSGKNKKGCYKRCYPQSHCKKGGSQCPAQMDECKKEGNCHMQGAQQGCSMEGDSCVMTREHCENVLGKEACEAMIQERGRCIMSKKECREKCTAGQKKCCTKEI